MILISICLVQGFSLYYLWSNTDGGRRSTKRSQFLFFFLKKKVKKTRSPFRWIWSSGQLKVFFGKHALFRGTKPMRESDPLSLRSLFKASSTSFPSLVKTLTWHTGWHIGWHMTPSPPGQKIKKHDNVKRRIFLKHIFTSGILSALSKPTFLKTTFI